MPVMSKSPLAPADLRAVALSAGCDPRTVDRYLAGGGQPSTTVRRIEAALREANRSDLVRDAARRTA